MPVIKARSIQDLKHRVNIHDVVARVVALKKAGGARFKGLCPFHSEKTPSFHVSGDKGFYKCFGCGKAGDILNFVMETEGLQFTEAAEAIAQRFSVALEYEEGSGPTREERSLRQELFEIHDLATAHFRQAFLAAGPHGDFIRNYWVAHRRFTPDLAEEFQIGFAPPDDGGLAAALWRRKFSEDALRQCGLFFVRDGAVLSAGTLRPRFRGRLMIPIRDHQGRVVAFTARQLELTPADDPAREAKYVNSPETPIFTKSHLLFNLDRARTKVGEGRPFVLVEGQLDAMRCWSVGLQTAVAPQGTSITEGQLLLLRRYLPQVECFFDSDSAGQKAALRFLPLALKAGLEVRFLMLAGAEKLDPDLLFLERGLAAYEDVRRSSLGAMEFAVRSLLPNAAAAGAEQKARTAQALFEIITQAEQEVVRTGFLEDVARHLRVPLASLERDLGAFVARQNRRAGNAGAPAPAPVAPRAPGRSPEDDLLLVCLQEEAMLLEVGRNLPHEWIDSESIAGRLLGRFLAEAEHNGWPGRDQLNGLLDNQDEAAYVAGLLFDPPLIENAAALAKQAVYRLRSKHLEQRLREIGNAMSAGSDRTYEENLALLKEHFAIKKELNIK